MFSFLLTVPSLRSQADAMTMMKVYDKAQALRMPEVFLFQKSF